MIPFRNFTSVDEEKNRRRREEETEAKHERIREKFSFFILIIKTESRFEKLKSRREIARETIERKIERFTNSSLDHVLHSWMTGHNVFASNIYWTRWQRYLQFSIFNSIDYNFIRSTRLTYFIIFIITWDRFLVMQKKTEDIQQAK